MEISVYDLEVAGCPTHRQHGTNEAVGFKIWSEINLDLPFFFVECGLFHFMFDIPFYFGQSPPELLQFSTESEPKPLFDTGILGGVNQDHPVSIFWVDFFVGCFYLAALFWKKNTVGKEKLPFPQLYNVDEDDWM